MLDHWRNEAKTCTLGWEPDSEAVYGKGYYLVGEWDNDITYCKCTSKDLENLKIAIDFLLRTE